jgi:hypothetical protein
MGFQDIKESVTWAATPGGENAVFAYLTQHYPRATDSGEAREHARARGRSRPTRAWNGGRT